MLTLTDINRALDRLGVRIFIPRTRISHDPRIGPQQRQTGRRLPRVRQCVETAAGWVGPGPKIARAWPDATAAAPGAAVAELVRPMNGNPLAESGREVPLVRGRVVILRPRVRIAVPAARRPRRLIFGVVVPLDERRIPRRRPERSSQIQWFVVGSAATLMLLFVVRLLLR